MTSEAWTALHIVKLNDADDLSPDVISIELVRFEAGDGLPAHDIRFSDIVRRHAISYGICFVENEYTEMQIILPSIMDEHILFNPFVRPPHAVVKIRTFLDNDHLFFGLTVDGRISHKVVIERSEI